MRAPALALLLLTLTVPVAVGAAQAQAGVAPAAPAPPAEVPVPGPASPPAPGPTPPPAPPGVAPLPGPPPPAAAATGVGTGRTGPPQATPAAPSRELIEKLGAGDRAYLAGDFRTALFAYQDATYLDPTSATGRIRLARAYAALGHKDQAERQLKQALELDPGNGEAQRLFEDLARPAVASPPVATAAIPALVAPAATSSPRIYRLTEDPAPAPLVAPVQAAPPPAASPQAAPSPAAVVGDQQEASRHYRAGLALIASRDFKGAVVELDQALVINPQLGVAVAARASAFYGMGRYQDAARDYEVAVALVPYLATPIYGLAESWRRLGDPRAAETYLRYADSGASDVKPELRETARQRAAQLAPR
jgi:Tfp pilus assembly protein PilF